MVESVQKLNSKGNKRGIHPNSLKNLHPNKEWIKGFQANPHGLSLVERLRRLMEKPLVKPSQDAPAIDLFLYMMAVEAIKGKPVQFKEVWERLEGKVVLPAEITGKEGGPILMSIIDELHKMANEDRKHPRDPNIIT